MNSTAIYLLLSYKINTLGNNEKITTLLYVYNIFYGCGEKYIIIVIGKTISNDNIFHIDLYSILITVCTMYPEKLFSVTGENK